MMLCYIPRIIIKEVSLNIIITDFLYSQRQKINKLIKGYKNKHWNNRQFETPVVKALAKVLHFVVEPEAQFYPTFYKSQATGQKAAIFRVPNQK